jgi:RNA polymerase subunit RPABC4/transcription elongation factor Spt4
MASTYFVAELDCPVCGTRSPADESTDIVTPLLAEGPAFLAVGDRADEISWATVSHWYPVLREPEPGEPIKLLETWACPNCGSENWVRITLDDGVVAAIEAVPLTRETILDAHAIASEVERLYRERTGENLFLDREHPRDFRDRLLAAL